MNKYNLVCLERNKNFTIGDDITLDFQVFNEIGEEVDSTGWEFEGCLFNDYGGSYDLDNFENDSLGVVLTIPQEITSGLVVQDYRLEIRVTIDDLVYTVYKDKLNFFLTGRS